MLLDIIEVDELEEDNRLKEKEIAKLTKTISKSKSKKETQSLVEELISTCYSIDLSLHGIIFIAKYS